MKKLLLLFFVFVFAFVSPMLAKVPNNEPDEPDYKKVVIIFDKTYENQSDDILSRELNEYLNNSNYKIFRIYMNCSPYCEENKITNRFNKALRRAADREPEFLIIGSPTLWTQFPEKINDFKVKYNVKVGLFNQFNSTDDFILNFNDKYSGYFVDYTRFDLNTFMFYTDRNGMDFNNFFILRDGSQKSLKISNYLKRDLRSHGIAKNVYVKTVSSLLSLKNSIVGIQNEKQGIIIPIISQLYDTDSTKEIMETITHHNIKHFELSVLEDDTKYLSFSISHVILNEFDNYKKSLEFDEVLNDLNLTKFLTEFKGDENIFSQREVYFIMNEHRTRMILNGRNILKFKSSFVDFLR